MEKFLQKEVEMLADSETIFGKDFLQREEEFIKNVMIEYGDSEELIVSYKRIMATIEKIFVIQLKGSNIIKYTSDKKILRDFLELFPSLEERSLWIGAAINEETFAGATVYRYEWIARIFCVEESHPVIAFYRIALERVSRYWNFHVSQENDHEFYE